MFLLTFTPVHLWGSQWSNTRAADEKGFMRVLDKFHYFISLDFSEIVVKNCIFLVISQELFGTCSCFSLGRETAL